MMTDNLRDFPKAENLGYSSVNLMVLQTAQTWVQLKELELALRMEPKKESKRALMMDHCWERLLGIGKVPNLGLRWAQMKALMLALRTEKQREAHLVLNWETKMDLQWVQMTGGR